LEPAVNAELYRRVSPAATSGAGVVRRLCSFDPTEDNRRLASSPDPRSMLPMLCLARHGETAWSLAGRHTGLTDVPLTERGENDARALGERLREHRFAEVWTSPLARAARTCDLAGFGEQAVRERDLVEWDYGEYEGRTRADIRQGRPGWLVFRDGCPGGESPADVGARADRVVTRARRAAADVLVFSSGHFLRVLAARWLGLAPEAGRHFLLRTGSLSVLGYEHDLSEPVIRCWDVTEDVIS
jgi:broad specificity phosphatase PhoE